MPKATLMKKNTVEILLNNRQDMLYGQPQDKIFTQCFYGFKLAAL